MGQQLFGWLILEHTVVSPGHWNWRLSRPKMARGDLTKRLRRDRLSKSPLKWRAKGACNGCGILAFAQSSELSLTSKCANSFRGGSPVPESKTDSCSIIVSNLQYSGKNISPCSPPIFRTETSIVVALIDVDMPRLPSIASIWGTLREARGANGQGIFRAWMVVIGAVNKNTSSEAGISCNVAGSSISELVRASRRRYKLGDIDFV